MQTPGITIEILACPRSDLYSRQHVVFADTSLQSWYCSDPYSMDEKEYPFLSHRFTNDNATVLVKPSMNWTRKEVHLTHNTMN